MVLKSNKNGCFVKQVKDLALIYYFLQCCLLMTSFPAVTGRVDYSCVFGEMISNVDIDGQPLEFCPTHMDPPFMTKGDFIWAYSDGRCHECVCEEDIGLACCDCPLARRG